MRAWRSWETSKQCGGLGPEGFYLSGREVTRNETGKGLVFLLGSVQFRILVGDAVSEGC